MSLNLPSNTTPPAGEKSKRPIMLVIIGLIIYASNGIVPNLAGGIAGSLPEGPIQYIVYFPLLLFTQSLPILGYILIGWGIILIVLPLLKGSILRATPVQEDIEAIRERIRTEPEKVEPIWDLGRANLQQYFNRNLSQINYIFWLSVGVMVVGFILIGTGISESFLAAAQSSNAIQGTAKAVSSVPPNAFAPAVVGGLAGIITEFIGATFLFIYRSTVQQAADYIKALERINSVGMAMKILDTISDESKELQDETKAEIVKQLLRQEPAKADK